MSSYTSRLVQYILVQCSPVSSVLVHKQTRTVQYILVQCSPVYSVLVHKQTRTVQYILVQCSPVYSVLVHKQTRTVYISTVFSGVAGGSKAASVVADLSETTFPGPDGDLT